MFSRGFLIVTPGITIRDRLRVLLPEDPDSYYRTRELVPPTCSARSARRRSSSPTTTPSSVARRWIYRRSVARCIQGRGEPPVTIETEGQMLQRACGDLLAMKNVVVINDEAHHCYRHKVDADDEELTKGEDKDEAKKNNEAARLWITGIEALKRKVGVARRLRPVGNAVLPARLGLRGRNALSLDGQRLLADGRDRDAASSSCRACRSPTTCPARDMPIYRDLWKHIGKEMPKKGRGKSGKLDPLDLPNELQTALYALYGHYAKTFDLWKRAGIEVPPVFIVVCNNTSTSNSSTNGFPAGSARARTARRQAVASRPS